MESCSSNNHFILKLSRLFPSSSAFASCRIRTIPDDVADTSITISKSHHDIDLSPSSSFPNSKPQKVVPTRRAISSALCKRNPLLDSSRSKSPLRGKVIVDRIRKSSSSHSAWFSSSDEKGPRAGNDAVESDTFFSLSSTSAAGDSFRLKSSRRFWDEMKRIDEKGSRSFSSVNSSNTVVTKSSKKNTISSTASGKAGMDKKSIKTNNPPEYELRTLDHMTSTDKLYYTTNGTGKNNSTAKRPTKNRRSRSRSRRTRVLPRWSLQCNDEMMKESYAVEKRSRDPRSDFRASMVEMIVEKQMFGSEDLERLLLCFLSLNSASYHRVIIDVFTEICETLFTN